MRFAGRTVAALAVAGLMVGCTTAPKTQEGKERLATNVDNTMMRIHQEDPTLKGFLDNSAGYVIFPHVGKGGFLVGGAYGRGIVYQNGAQIGYADISEASVGAQIGGQQYALIVAFEKQVDVDRFKNSKFTLGANASAVALKSGVAKTTRFQDGTAIFVYPLAGGMVEASVAGKSLTFVPMGGERSTDMDRNTDRNMDRSMDRNMDRSTTRPSNMP